MLEMKGDQSSNITHVSPTQIMDDVTPEGGQSAVVMRPVGSADEIRERQGQEHESDARPVDGDADEIAEEARKPLMVQAPVQPTRAERDEHEKTHMPYRSWCVHCVRGRGRSDAHKTNPVKEEYRKPQLSADYWFLGAAQGELGQEDTHDKTPVLVMYEKLSKCTFAHVVPCKGPDPTVTAKIVADLDSMGYKSIVVKTDQESAITALFRSVKVAWSGDLIIEMSPKGDSQGNGAAESAVNVVEGMVRTHKSALESRLDCIILPKWNVVSWIVEWVALMLRRYKMGDDGLTPYGRIKGKKPSRAIVELGERVLFMEVRSHSERRPNLDV